MKNVTTATITIFANQLPGRPVEAEIVERMGGPDGLEVICWATSPSGMQVQAVDDPRVTFEMDCPRELMDLLCAEFDVGMGPGPESD